MYLQSKRCCRVEILRCVEGVQNSFFATGNDTLPTIFVRLANSMQAEQKYLVFFLKLRVRSGRARMHVVYVLTVFQLTQGFMLVF